MKRTSARRAALAALAAVALAASLAPQALAGEPSVGEDGGFSSASDGASASASTKVDVLVSSDLAASAAPQSACGLPDDVAAVTLRASATGAAGEVSVRWTRSMEGADGVERDDASFGASGEAHPLAGDAFARGATYRYRAIVQDASGATAASAPVIVSVDYREFGGATALVDGATGVSAEGTFYDDGRSRASLSVRPVGSGEGDAGLAAVYGALAKKAAELGGSVGLAYEASLLLPAAAPAGVPASTGGVQLALPMQSSAFSPIGRAITLDGALGASRVRVVRWDAAAGTAVEVPGGARVSADGSRAAFSADLPGVFAIVRDAPLPDDEHKVAVDAGEGGSVLYQGVPVAGGAVVPHGADARFQVLAQAGWVIERVTADGAEVPEAAGLSSFYVDLKGVVDGSRSVAARFRAVGPVPGGEFTLTTSAGEHGSVVPDTGPAGVRVPAGSVQTVRFLPEEGYRVSAVTVTQNGASSTVPAPGDAYTFAVVADVRVHAEFEQGGPAPAPVHAITASASGPGSVSPTSAEVSHGGEATFSFLPEEGCRAGTVLVDGQPVEAGASYTFRNVVADHRLEVVFEQDDAADDAVPGASYVVHASAGPGGRVSPAGDVRVAEGASATFAFVPDEGFAVSRVVVDGQDAGCAPCSWTFDNVREDHTVEVSFARVRAFGLAPTGDRVVSLTVLAAVLAAGAAALILSPRRACAGRSRR